MLKTKLLLLSILISGTYGHSQEIALPDSATLLNVQEVIELFKAKHHIQFSYDVEQMQQTFIPINGNTLSFGSFKKSLKDISIDLEKDQENNYLVVQSQKNNEYCIKIIDNLSGSPVPNTTIYKDTQLLGITDYAGRAILDVQPGSLLTYHYTGYTPFSQIVNISQAVSYTHLTLPTILLV